MPRKLAALAATGFATMLVLGTLVAFALLNQTSATSSRTTRASSPQTSPATVKTSIRPSTSVTGPASPQPGAGRVVYLTFDDGPDPTWTPQVLAVLAKYGAKATFFELGDMIAAHPGLSEQVRAAGHTIGNHSISHRELTVISAPRRHREIVEGPKSRCFRPPYGATNAKVRADIKAAGMTQILWDIDPRDWDRPGQSAIAQNVLTHAHPGAVILLHDGGGNRSQTVAALDTILRVLTGRGYRFPAMNC